MSCTTDQESRKVKLLTLKQKLDLIKDKEKNNYNINKLCEKYGISRSNTYNILKNKSDVKKALLSGKNLSSKRDRLSGPGAQIDKEVFEWFLEAKSTGRETTGPIIQSKAREIANHLNVKFSASNGWLSCFKKRHNINEFTNPDLSLVESDSLDEINETAAIIKTITESIDEESISIPDNMHMTFVKPQVTLRKNNKEPIESKSLHFQKKRIANKKVGKKKLSTVASQKLNEHRLVCPLPNELPVKTTSTSTFNSEESTTAHDLGFVVKQFGNNHRFSALCLVCNKMQSNTSVVKLHNHRMKCKLVEKLDDNENTDWRDVEYIEMKEFEDNSEIDNRNSHMNTIASPKIQIARTVPQGEMINDMLAKCIYGLNLPANVFTSEIFKNFVSTLNNSYMKQYPSLETLNGITLESMYALDVKRIEYSVGFGKDAILLVYLSDYIHNKDIVLTSWVQFSIGVRFLLFVSTVSDNTNATYELPEFIQKSIIEAEKLFNCNIYAIVSENSSYTEYIPELDLLFHHSCIRESLNKFVDSLLSHNQNRLQKIIDKIAIVNKYICESNIDTIIERSGQSIVIPSKFTHSQLKDILKAFLTNLPIMHDIKNTHKIDIYIENLICDSQLKADCNEMLLYFEPISTCFELADKNMCSIGDAEDIRNLLCEYGCKFINTEFASLVNLSINDYFNDFVLSASYLNPIKPLRENEVERVSSFIQTFLTDNGKKQFDAFENREGIFSTLPCSLQELDCPIKYWINMEINCPELSKLAIRILQLPGSLPSISKTIQRWAMNCYEQNIELISTKAKQLLHLSQSNYYKNSW